MFQNGQCILEFNAQVVDTFLLMLDAYLDNQKAHNFYESQGFVKRGYHFLKSL